MDEKKILAALDNIAISRRVDMQEDMRTVWWDAMRMTLVNTMKDGDVPSNLELKRAAETADEILILYRKRFPDAD